MPQVSTPTADTPSHRPIHYENRSKWLLRASKAVWASLTVRRLPLVLGTERTGPSLAVVRVRLTCRVPISRSMSSHFSPNNSPCLSPVVTAKM
jgi:hypothetical protein